MPRADKDVIKDAANAGIVAILMEKPNSWQMAERREAETKMAERREAETKMAERVEEEQEDVIEEEVEEQVEEEDGQYPEYTAEEEFADEAEVEEAAATKGAEVEEPTKTAKAEKAVIKKKRPQPIPKDSKGFYRARAKAPTQFRYTTDGNLQVPEMQGQQAKVIELPFYRPATIDELREAEEKRLNDLAAKEEEFNTVKKQLREALAEWRETSLATPVVKLQKDLLRLDAERTYLRTPLVWIQTFKNPDIRSIDFSNMGEKRKLGYNVRGLRLRHHTFEDTVKSSNRPFVVEAKEAEVAKPKKPEETFAVFFDPADEEHGFLSPDTLVDFNFRGTLYFTPIQAYERERVKELGRDLDVGTMIKKQKSARGVRKMGSMLVGQAKDPRGLWIEIIQAVVAQHPRFEEKLRSTNKDILIYANPTDEVAGIGLPEEDESVTDRSQWKGKNFLGEAWMAVRQQLEEGGGEQMGGGVDAPEEDATKARKQEEVRKGVLMGYYRRNRG